MAAETAGDPMTGLKWTRRTTARIAAELRSLGIEVCPRTVARLLRTMGFALRVNHKKRAGASHPDRDAQFQHIAGLRRRCAAENLPIVSVDTKKKELVGNFKNPGPSGTGPVGCEFQIKRPLVVEISRDSEISTGCRAQNSIRRQTPASGTTRADSSAGHTSGRVSPAPGCRESLPKIPGDRIFAPYTGV